MSWCPRSRRRCGGSATSRTAGARVPRDRRRQGRRPPPAGPDDGGLRVDTSDATTVDLVPSLEDLAAEYFGPATPPVRVDFGALSHPGKVRPHNEDHYAVVRR